MRTVMVHGCDKDIPVCSITLGTDYYGAKISKERAFEIMDAYYAAGGRTLDTARLYGKDVLTNEAIAYSESVVGEWLRTRGVRDSITLITKGAFPNMSDWHISRLSPEEIDHDLKISLHDLDLPYVDIYFLHRDDPSLPVGPIIDTLNKYVKEGKIRALGASNWRAARIREANEYAASKGLMGFSISQVNWSAAEVEPCIWNDDTLVTMDDKELKEYAELGIPVMAFSSQARGYFTKKLTGQPLSNVTLNNYDTPENQRRAANIQKLCDETGATPTAVTLAYLTCCPDVKGIAVIGCSNPAQVADSMAGADLELTAEQRNSITG